jgi:hypothetical protein
MKISRLYKLFTGVYLHNTHKERELGTIYPSIRISARHSSESSQRISIKSVIDDLNKLLGTNFISVRAAQGTINPFRPSNRFNGTNLSIERHDTVFLLCTYILNPKSSCFIWQLFNILD